MTKFTFLGQKKPLFLVNFLSISDCFEVLSTLLFTSSEIPTQNNPAKVKVVMTQIWTSIIAKISRLDTPLELKIISSFVFVLTKLTRKFVNGSTPFLTHFQDSKKWFVPGKISLEKFHVSVNMA